MPPTQRQSLMTVMAQATSPSPRLWPPETCDEHQSLTMGMSDSSDSLGQKDTSTSSTIGEKERAPWPVTLGTLLALQLGWGLWLMPAVYARLGWLPGTAAIGVLTLLTAYSGFLISRLVHTVSGAILFGDIGEAAAGAKGRNIVYGIVYTLGATRCIILQLATTESLKYAIGSSDDKSLLVYGLAVAIVALVMVQIKSLSNLGWFLSFGTFGQLFAAVVVVYKLTTSPRLGATTELVHAGEASTALVAVMNIIFAYGGQFAFVEVINSMQQPKQFPGVISFSTSIMGAAFVGIGMIGYWSRGIAVPDVIIFGIGDDWLARAACNAILIQGIGQYLVNLNIWTHNILTLLARSQGAKYAAHIESSADHHWLSWLAGTTFVVAYSFLISMTVPYFSSLVALVTSATYLITAYTIPCCFTLALLRDRLRRPELALCTALIPLSLLMSCAGVLSAFQNLMENVRGGVALRT
ncbi:probable amino acid transporter AVT1D [Coccomyxa sp. Obi]|nr:probable amino acid transporter AVT1D [Coccomyxa sp. Obi]